MTEKEAWEAILGRIAYPWLCHHITHFQRDGLISRKVHDRMFDAIRRARRAKHVPEDEMRERGLWPYTSPLRIAWVKKQIKRLEGESAPSVLP